MKPEKIQPARLRPLLPPRRKDSHKNNYGHVLVVAGSRGMTGAAVLAAKAALKCGAGLVTVACPSSERRLVALALPEAMTFPAASRGGAFTPAAAAGLAALHAKRRFDVLLAGPGLGQAPGAAAFVIGLLRKVRLPSVLDADALNAVAAAGSFPEPAFPAIITPHPGEAARLLGAPVKDRPAAAKALARACGGVAVLKGRGTLVSDGTSVLLNTSGGPELAKAGAGDVLAGFCAGFYAQAGLARGFSLRTALSSAALAAYLHGLCGTLAARKYTERGVLASELIAELPSALRRLGGK